MLCFIKIETINEYKEIILKKLRENKKYDKFVLYLKKYIFKLNPNIYNYNKLCFCLFNDITINIIINILINYILLII